MPGIDAVRCFSRAITTETSSRRSPRGFSVITSRPTLVVGLTEPAPITETTPITSGSALIASAACGLPALHLGKGNVGTGLGHRGDRGGVLQRQEALGRDTYRISVAAMVAKVTSSVARWRCSTHSSVR